MGKRKIDSSDEENEFSGKSSPLVKRIRKEPEEKKSVKKPKSGSKVANNNKGKPVVTKNDDKFMLDLGKKKHVTIDIFKGQPLVNIREFYVVDGEERPGKKGIALTLEQWEQLRDNVEVINNHIKKITKA